jgi:hypothetical protein
LRHIVGKWRLGNYDGVTSTTRKLLEYWRRPDRDKRLYFCQIEAAETAIFLAEVADRKGGAWILRELERANEERNPLLARVAFKMATGSGKTVVMAMLIAWQALNKLASPKDSRFSDAFLIVTPGITIRDRLRVLLPNEPDNYYRKPQDVMPAPLPALFYPIPLGPAWAPYQVQARANDALFPGEWTFDTNQSYAQMADGSILAEFLVTGKLPTNTFSPGVGAGGGQHHGKHDDRRARGRHHDQVVIVRARRQRFAFRADGNRDCCARGDDAGEHDDVLDHVQQHRLARRRGSAELCALRGHSG